VHLNDHRIEPTATDSPLALAQIQQGLAHHEAAHAVVAAVLGVPCTRVRVMRVERGGAAGWTGATSYSNAPVSAYGLALIAAAGEHGELRHLKVTGRLTPGTSAAARSDHDRDTAIRACAALGFRIVLQGRPPADPDQGATWTEVSNEARDLVAEHWAAVRSVAAALLATRDLTLTGRQVAALVPSHHN
jgi:hypothetical protein